MTNQDMAKEIIGLVGGEANVSQLTHCATRLRFALKDEAKADIKKLGMVEGVLTAQNKGGQIQVVIGARVDQVYDEILKQYSIQAGGEVEDDGTPAKKRNPINAVLETIAGIFTPILLALIGCGMMQCLAKIAVQLGVPGDSGFIVIVTMIGGSIFYFMPFFLAVSAARKFKTNEALAVCLAACYMHPTIMNAESVIYFAGIPLKNMSYASTVIPIVFSVFVLKYVYSFVNKWIPEVVKVVLVPIVTLIIMVPLQLALLGPMGSYIGTGISDVMLGLFQLNGAIAGAAFGVALKSKNKVMKAAGSSAGITALFGITEPAIYGVNLRYKRPFFAACGAAALSSGFLSMVGGRATAVALPGILSLSVYEANSYIFVLIAVAASFLLGMVFTMVAGFKED